jgi:hypothetical protein
MEKLIWFCTTAQPAEPWLPTVAQQDGAWLTVFGPSLEKIRATVASGSGGPEGGRMLARLRLEEIDRHFTYKSAVL